MQLSLLYERVHNLCAPIAFQGVGVEVAKFIVALHVQKLFFVEKFLGQDEV